MKSERRVLLTAEEEREILADKIRSVSVIAAEYNVEKQTVRDLFAHHGIVRPVPSRHLPPNRDGYEMISVTEAKRRLRSLRENGQETS